MNLEAQNHIRLVLQVPESQLDFYTESKAEEIADDMTYYINWAFRNTGAYQLSELPYNYDPTDSLRVDIVGIQSYSDSELDTIQSTAKRASSFAHNINGYFSEITPIKNWERFGTPNTLNIMPKEKVWWWGWVGATNSQVIDNKTVSTIVINGNLLHGPPSAHANIYTFICHELLHLLHTSNWSENIHDTAYPYKLTDVDLNNDGVITSPEDVQNYTYSLGKWAWPYSYIMTTESAQNCHAGAKQVEMNYPWLEPLEVSFPASIKAEDVQIDLTLGTNWNKVAELQTTIYVNDTYIGTTTSQLTSNIQLSISNTQLQKGENTITYTIINPYSGEQFEDEIQITKEEENSIAELGAIGIKVLSADQHIVIENTGTPLQAISIYNISGAQVQAYLQLTDPYRFESELLHPGIYVLSIQQGDRLLTHKVYVH